MELELFVFMEVNEFKDFLIGLIFFGFCLGKLFLVVQVLVICGYGQVLVIWQFLYFGYEKQYFLVQYFIDNVKFINVFDVIKEYIKEKIF